MEAVKEYWKTSRGHKIFAWHLLPVAQPKAVLLLVHGCGEHSWRYLQWAKKFTYDGFAFFSWDHAGHGLSEGRRGHVRHYEQYLLEIDLAITKVREKLPNVPIILYGHSMGGNIAINYAIRRSSPIKLLLVTSPWLELSAPVPKYVQVLSKILYLIAPFYSFKSSVKPDQISHVDEEVEKYAADPLIHAFITPRLFASIEHAGRYALRNAGRIKISTLLMHGSADPITSVYASRRIAALIPNIKYVEWPGLYHEIHNETQQNDAYCQINEWINYNLK